MLLSWYYYYVDFLLFLTQSNAGHRNSNKIGRTNMQVFCGELGNASSEIPFVIYYNQCGRVRTVGAETLQDGSGRGVDYGRMVGLCHCLGRTFIFTSRFKLYLRPFPEASKHIEDELPSLLTDKVASTFSQTFSAPTTRIYGPLWMKRSASSSS
jgi:hypothetical protein